jgi:hypothetical protein
MKPICCLKVDVDTHDGMRDGVPRLLDAFRRAVDATGTGASVNDAVQ